jgi:hypothetical protein
MWDFLESQSYSSVSFCTHRAFLWLYKLWDRLTSAWFFNVFKSKLSRTSYIFCQQEVGDFLPFLRFSLFPQCFTEFGSFHHVTTYAWPNSPSTRENTIRRSCVQACFLHPKNRTSVQEQPPTPVLRPGAALPSKGSLNQEGSLHSRDLPHCEQPRVCWQPENADQGYATLSGGVSGLSIHVPAS